MKSNESPAASPVLVLGATGLVGGLLVAELTVRGVPVRAASRRPRDRSSGPSVEWVDFDFERPGAFAPALAGVGAVFLIARPGDDHADRVAFPLIDEMKRQGVRRVVDLSAMGAELRDDFALRKIERRLEDEGFAYTHLRPNWFMQILADGPLFADIRRTGAFHLPAGDARLSYIDARDIAAVAATALAEPGHENQAYTLTGGEALDHGEVAALLSAAADRPIGYVALSEDEARAGLAKTFSAERVERLIGFYRLVRAGHCSPVSAAVGNVLGRAPITFARFAADHAARWRDLAETNA